MKINVNFYIFANYLAVFVQKRTKGKSNNYLYVFLMILVNMLTKKIIKGGRFFGDFV